MERTPILQKALQKAGGISATARYLGLTRQAVAAWPDVPLKYLNQVSALSGISRKQLAPHLYAAIK